MYNKKTGYTLTISINEAQNIPMYKQVQKGQIKEIKINISFNHASDYMGFHVVDE